MECVFLDIWRQKRKNIIATPISNTDRTLRLRKFCAPCWLNLEKTKKPRENQNTKKPKLFRECLVWGSCLFFFGFPRVFLVFFGHDLEKTKKTQGFFVFFEELLLEVSQKTMIWCFFLKLFLCVLFHEHWLSLWLTFNLFWDHVFTRKTKRYKKFELLFHDPLAE